MELQKKFEGKHSELTGKLLGAFFQLHKESGFGFSEKVYESALEVLLTELGMIVERQREFIVRSTTTHAKDPSLGRTFRNNEFRLH